MMSPIKEIESKLGIEKSRKEILAMPTEKLREYLKNATSREIYDLADGNFRHRKDGKIYDALGHWLKIARCFGYATKDDSWGEFEKEFAIIIRRMVQAERVLKKMGIEDAWEYESQNENSSI